MQISYYGSSRRICAARSLWLPPPSRLNSRRGPEEYRERTKDQVGHHTGTVGGGRSPRSARFLYCKDHSLPREEASGSRRRRRCCLTYYLALGEGRAQLTRASEKHTTAPSSQQCTRAPNQLRVVFRLTRLAVELSLSGVHQLDTAAACSPFSRLVSHGCAQGCGWASLDRRSQPEDAPCRSRRPARRRHSKASPSLCVHPQVLKYNTRAPFALPKYY